MLGEFEIKISSVKKNISDFETVEKNIKSLNEQIEDIYEHIALSGKGTYEIKRQIKNISNEMKTIGHNVYDLREILEQIVRMYAFTEGRLSRNGEAFGILGESVEDFFSDILDKVEDVMDAWKEQLKEKNENVVNRIKDENTRNGFSEEYQSTLQRIYEDVPKEYNDAKILYDKYSKDVVVADFHKVDSKGNASPYQLNGKLYLNTEADMNNARGDGTTYYHEYGHFIVYEEGWVEGSECTGTMKAFEESLRKEISQYYESYEKQYRQEGIEKGYSGSKLEKYIENQTAQVIEQDINGSKDEYYHVNNGLSDIIDGVSNGKYQPSYGHGDGYWDENQSRVANEAFAQLFSAQMTGDTQEIEKMKELMPETYEIYCKMIQEAGDN